MPKVTKEAIKALRMANCELSMEIHVNVSLWFITENSTKKKWHLDPKEKIGLNEAIKIIKSFAYYAGRNDFHNEYLNL